MAPYRHKSGPGRAYTADELALFAQYRGARERVRPRACAGGEQCWVALGPPGISTGGRCLVCNGVPRSTTAPGYYGLGRRP